MTVDRTVVPTAEVALVVTEAAPARRELARLGLVVRALTLLFILTNGVDTSYSWVETTFPCTPTTGILALTEVLTSITLVGRLPPFTRPRTVSALACTAMLVMVATMLGGVLL